MFNCHEYREHSIIYNFITSLLHYCSKLKYVFKFVDFKDYVSKKGFQFPPNIHLALHSPKIKWLYSLKADRFVSFHRSETVATRNFSV